MTTPAKIVLYTDCLFEEHEAPDEHPECAERAIVIASALERCGAVESRIQSVTGAIEDVLRIHDPDYVEAVRAAAEAGGASLDADTYISPRSFEVALAASGTVVAATDAALAASGDDPTKRAFAVVRPPGHHARPSRGMGFCLFNNVAVAAARAREVGGLDRVAIVDFDVHHGNGTQEAFWREGGVLYVSLHRSPFYPGTGARDETGEAGGKGANLNVPLGEGTTARQYQDAFRATLDAVASFRPQLVIASAGFDAYEDDPIGGLGLGLEHYRWIGAELRALADATCDGRLVAALEGGYALDALGDLAREFVEGMAGETQPPE